MKILEIILSFITSILLSLILDRFILKEWTSINELKDIVNENKAYLISILGIGVIEGELIWLLSWGKLFLMFYLTIFVLYKIAYIDIKKKLIEAKLLILLVVVCVLFGVWNESVGIVNSIITALVTFVILFIVSKVTKGGFGMGDSKVISVLGFLLGYEGLIGLMIVASISVGLSSIVLLIKSRKNREIPFAPFLLFSLLLLININNI